MCHTNTVNVGLAQTWLAELLPDILGAEIVPGTRVTLEHEVMPLDLKGLLESGVFVDAFDSLEHTSLYDVDRLSTLLLL